MGKKLIAVRLDSDMVDRIDQQVQQDSREYEDIDRSKVIRKLLRKVLD